MTEEAEIKQTTFREMFINRVDSRITEQRAEIAQLQMENKTLASIIVYMLNGRTVAIPQEILSIIFNRSPQISTNERNLSGDVLVCEVRE